MKPARVSLKPAHPDRICWGATTYCPADDLACGNGTIRTLHPIELFGEDWLEWSEADGPASAPYVTTDRARRREVMSPMD